MIISHSHKFIFLHGRKTAGSSIGTSLNRFLSAGDASMGYVGACRDAGITPPDWEKRWRHLRPWDLRHRKPGYAAYKRLARTVHGLTSTHMSAASVKALVGNEVWQSYFKFTFERNPLERLVSFYFWRTKGRADAPSFSTFIGAIEAGDVAFLAKHHLKEYSSLDTYSLDGRVCVDMIGRFEHLQTDLAAVGQRLGIAWDGWLPSEKKGLKPKHAATKVWDESDQLKERVIKLLAQEAALLGYRL